tara:strand:- start:890 stop:1078 length:189 start_codon:yes stop_codon:yes gene_type:complete
VEEEEFLSVLLTHHFIVVTEQMVSVTQEQTTITAELFVTNVMVLSKEDHSTVILTVQVEFHV